MRILYHHRILAADGMQVHVKELISALKYRSHEIELVGPGMTSGSGKASLTSRLGDLRSVLPKFVGEGLEIGYNLKAYRQLKEAAAAFRPDFIYERYNSFLIAGLWLKRRLNVPLLVEVNSPLRHERRMLDNLALDKTAGYMERKLWLEADAVLPVSHALADFVRDEGVDEQRIHVIPNGVRLDAFRGLNAQKKRRELGLSDKIVFGFVGFVRPWHGLERVLHAFAGIGDTRLHLLVVGEGPASQSLQRTAHALGIADRLTFTGTRPHEEIPHYLSAMDVALQPDVNAYASPLKLFEYLAAGCAVIAPNRPNIREIVEDGVTALLIEPTDEADLSNAISKLAKDTELRRSLGAAAKDLIRQRDYSWAGNARRVEKIAQCAINVM